MATKAEKMMAESGQNIMESLGQGATNGSPPAPPVIAAKSAKNVGIKAARDVAEIEINRIVADPNQPRKEFDEEKLEGLSTSMKNQGQQQTARVRWSEADQVYFLISGERRWRAAQRAGLPTLLCVIEKKDLGEKELRINQLIENIQREDLSPMDLAKQFHSLIVEHGYSQSQLSLDTGYERTKIVKSLALLDLPPEVQEMVETGALSGSTAYEISKAPGSEAQVEVARVAIDQDLSRADTVEEVKKVVARSEAVVGEGRGVTGSKGKKKSKASAKKKPDLIYQRLFNRNGHKLHFESKKGADRAGLLELLDHARETVAAEKAELELVEVED